MYFCRHKLNIGDETMDISKRNIFIYLVLSVALLALSYVYNFNDSKESIYSCINERFNDEAPFWGDSIQKILGLQRMGRYNYEQDKPVTTMYSKDDTIEISTKYFPRENLNFWLSKNLESALLRGGHYSCTITDSLFRAMLLDIGFEAVTATELHIRDLKEMFPTKDSMNINAPVREVRRNRIVEGFATDTVGVGICDQGILIGKVAISNAVVISNMQWIAWPQIILLVIVGLLFVTVSYVRKNIRYIQKLHFIGNSCIDFNNNVIYRRNGDCIPVTGNKVLLLEILAESAPEYRLLKEDVCQRIWKRDGKDGQALYNVAVSDLRKYLINDDDSLELKTLPKEGIQLLVDSEKVKRYNRLYFVYTILM